MEEEIIKKIALFSAKQRISPQTGFIHVFIENPYASRQDTIPFLENFLYVYALFRSKTVENIQEGKSFLEKLLAFEVKGNFPVYLHEFPNCKDGRLSSHLLPPLFYLLRDFSLALGEVYGIKLRSLASRIVDFLQKQESLSSGAQGRLEAFLKVFNPSLWTPKSPEEWGEFCLCCQMAEIDFPFKKPLWNSHLGVFIGESKDRIQEGYEPAITLLDLFMGKGSKRALLDHPVHLKASLVHPWKREAPTVLNEPFVCLMDEKQRQCWTLYWGDLEQVHSLVLEAKKGSWTLLKSLEGWICTYNYDELVPGEEDSMEWAFYLDGAKEHRIAVEEDRTTMFYPEEKVTILSKELKITFKVQVDPSQGSFTGHISKGDRSFQKSKKLPYGGFDWRFAWRTIRREAKASLSIHISISVSF